MGGEVSTHPTKRLASPVAPKVQVKADEAKAKSVHQKCRYIHSKGGLCIGIESTVVSSKTSQV